MKNDPPLCVDLDGTLIRGDCLYAAMAWQFRRNPFKFLALLSVYFTRGRAAYKRRLAEETDFDAATMHINQEVLEWCVAQKNAGRKLWLVTGSDQKWAEQVAAKLGIFEHVLASDGTRNVSGRGKRDTLVELCGERGYDYVGNSKVDMPVWEKARSVVLANCPRTVRVKARERFDVVAELGNAPRLWLALFRALRPHQWLKNLLVFAPIMTSHQWGQPALWVAAAQAFLLFSVAASGVYLINDFYDRESDAAAPVKRERPVASGELGEFTALGIGLLLVGISVLASVVFSPVAAGFVAGYCALAMSYSLWLKKILLVDVLVLSAFYVLRIFVGGAFTGIVISPWLAVFAFGAFLFLAALKRLMFPGETWSAAGGLIKGLTLGAGAVIATGTLAAYAFSEQALLLYSRPLVLLAAPLVFTVWAVRTFFFATSFADTGKAVDPFSVVMRDVWSWAALTVFVLIILLAK